MTNIQTIISKVSKGQEITIIGTGETVTGKVCSICTINESIVVLDNVTRRFRTICAENLHTIKAIV